LWIWAIVFAFSSLRLVTHPLNKKSQHNQMQLFRKCRYHKNITQHIFIPTYTTCS
jgi:hypothetical protein